MNDWPILIGQMHVVRMWLLTEWPLARRRRPSPGLSWLGGCDSYSQTMDKAVWLRVEVEWIAFWLIAVFVPGAGVAKLFCVHERWRGDLPTICIFCCTSIRRCDWNLLNIIEPLRRNKFSLQVKCGFVTSSELWKWGHESSLTWLSLQVTRIHGGGNKI